MMLVSLNIFSVAKIDLTRVLLEKQKAEEKRQQFPYHVLESNVGERPVSLNGLAKDNANRIAASVREKSHTHPLQLANLVGNRTSERDLIDKYVEACPMAVLEEVQIESEDEDDEEDKDEEVEEGEGEKENDDDDKDDDGFLGIGSPKRPRQEEEEEIEDIQADPIPPSPINIPLVPPSSPITPFPSVSTPQTPPSPSPLDIPLSPPAPISPQQQHLSAEPTDIHTPITEETHQPMETSPHKDTAQPMEKIDEEKQLEREQHQPAKVDVPILMQVVAKETEIQKTRANQAQEEIANLRIVLELVTKERDSSARENENFIRDLMDLQSQLTRKEVQNHELIKNDKKMKEQLKYEDARYQKLNTSYNTVKNTLTALLQNQEPAAEAPSTSDSAALNTLAALQAELQTEKLQRQLLVSGFMSQTAQHEAKVKQLEEELAKAKAELAAMDSLASTSQIQQAETHMPIQPPQLPEMPEFQGIEEKEQQRPALGALDIREEIEQEIEDLP
ncbi:hypothetical protein L7F22_064749 [Adiantum nelumboides]|nr:hypothetical protein [Adiantum nelumboides]